MKKNILIVGAFLLLAGVFVFAQGVIPPGLISVFGPVPLVSCSESDGGANIYVQGFNSVTYLGSNGTVLNATSYDFCLNNDTLVEGVCSSWINANFNLSLNTSGYAATFNCSASNTINVSYGCVNGACAPITTNQTGGGGNSTNQTGNQTGNTTLLADLIISPFNYTALVIGNATNSTGNTTTIFTYNVTLLSTVRNIGNAAAGASTTRFTVTGGAQQLVATPAIPIGGNALVTGNYVLTSGTKTATSNADWLNAVPESNNNNNAASITFTLP